MDRIVEKQFLLTGFLEYLLDANFCSHPNDSPHKLTASIITPRDPALRGSQLSVYFSHDLETVHGQLERRGVICDLRDHIMRIAPAPLYNSYEDVWNFICAIREVGSTLFPTETNLHEPVKKVVRCRGSILYPYA